jgi:hypothetical protein
MLEIVNTYAQSVPIAEENADTQPRGALFRGGEWLTFVLPTTPGTETRGWVDSFISFHSLCASGTSLSTHLKDRNPIFGILYIPWEPLGKATQPGTALWGESAGLS